VVLIEHHDPGWAQTATDSRIELDALVLGLSDVRRHPPFVSAVARYEVEGNTFRHPFTARVLSVAEISDELARVGLRLRRGLTNGWTEAVSLGRRSAWEHRSRRRTPCTSRVG